MAEPRKPPPKRVGKRARQKQRRWLGWVLAALVMVSLAGAGAVYWVLGAGNLQLEGKSYLYIPTGATYTQVLDSLTQRRLLDNPTTFRWTAGLLQYDRMRVKPGRYALYPGMSNYALIRDLRIGRQEPVALVVPQVRTLNELARALARQLEPKRDTLLAALQDEALLKPHNLTPQTAIRVFIPNTYEMFWNVSARELLWRMVKEYDRWWSPRRKAKARELGLSLAEVAVLASIVDAETNHRPEMPTIAGVYLNRLRQGMKLQADPTVVFAHQDFSIRRVTGRHLQLDSPYNTYKYAGLPPGPINNASSESLDAVLNAETHDYLYFSASPSMDGTHLFARNLREHQANARQYHQKLNQLHIR